MSDQAGTRALVAKHGAMLERARGIAESGGAERVAEAKRVINLLAEAFAWLAAAPTPEALASGKSLLRQAEERLGLLEARGETATRTRVAT